MGNELPSHIGAVLVSLQPQNHTLAVSGAVHAIRQ